MCSVAGKAFAVRKYIVLLLVFALLAFLSTSDIEIKIYAYAGIGKKEKRKHTYEGCKKREQD